MGSEFSQASRMSCWGWCLGAGYLVVDSSSPGLEASFEDPCDVGELEEAVDLLQCFFGLWVHVWLVCRWVWLEISQ